MAKKNSKIVLIDSNALIHRAFHALPPLSTPKGEIINAVYGFTTILFKVLSEIKPDYIVCTFDYPAPTFRHKEYKDYKIHRKKAPDELYSQIPKTKELVRTLNIPVFEKRGYEADDIIGALAKKTKSLGLETIIVTGDLDELQLVNDKTFVYTMRRGFSDTILYDQKQVRKKFDLNPDQLVDYKALRGDQSDNIPGVLGIGEKTAASLIKKYKTLDNLYKNLNDLPEKTRKLLEKSKKEAFLSKKLATIVVDLPLKFDLKKAKSHDYDKDKAIKLFRELGFKSLITRLWGVKEVAIKRPISKSQLGLFDNVVKNKEKINASNIDQTLGPVLQKMQTKGILIDTKNLSKLSQETAKKIDGLEKKIYKEAGHKFNINSPQQLAQILFEELKLPVIKKIKTGYSTDQAVLRELSETHPIIELILSYREIYKLKSTYIDALPKLADGENRVHTTYSQDTSTGRLSSKDPNLQNIPTRTELGQEVRAAFIAPTGYKLLAADYSQIELRIVASIANDRSMIESFDQGDDIHAQTAAEIFNTKINKVSKDMRRIAKVVNFGIIYGMGIHGLVQTLGIRRDEAQDYIDNYFSFHPEVLDYMEKTKIKAFQKGYVETLFGRQRYLPEIKSKYPRFRKSAERMAINMPIQGTAADLIKMAMIQIDRELKTISNKTSMLLQVHDELVFEIPKGDIEKVKKFVKDKMENVYELKVPVKVEISVGNNWGELK
jgi:DNA polymerase I-like protein with 3'-5' exonuclease and polymerase domains/5'-3' exonuclease